MNEKTIPVSLGQTIEIEILDINSFGAGVGKFSGFTIFIKNAIPKEIVSAKITKIESNFALGEIQSILTKSPSRITPKCPVYQRCGGCDLAHIDISTQLQLKKKIVENAFSRIGKLDVTINDVLPSSSTAFYRNKGAFPFGINAKGVMCGLFANGTHDVVEFDTCYIHNDICIKAMNVVKQFVQANKILPYNIKDNTGLIKHVVVRTTTLNETMVTLVLTQNTLPFYDALIAMLKTKVPTVKSVNICVSKGRNKNILTDNIVKLYGEKVITEEVLGLKFPISPQSFLQVNPEQTTVLYNTVLDYANPKGKIIIDGYCGVGTISLALAKSAKHVYGVEIVEKAIHNALAAKKLNSIKNATFTWDKCEDAIPKLLKEGIHPDLITLDPPRSGLDKKLTQAIIAANIPEIVYISCNPGTLARDCALLKDGGYTIDKIQPVDMFPQTSHVETVVLMSKVK